MRFGELPLSAKRQNIEKTNVNKMPDTSEDFKKFNVIILQQTFPEKEDVQTMLVLPASRDTFQIRNPSWCKPYRG